MKHPDGTPYWTPSFPAPDARTTARFSDGEAWSLDSRGDESRFLGFFDSLDAFGESHLDQTFTTGKR